MEGVVCTSRDNHPGLLQSTPGGSHGLLPARAGLYTSFIAFGPVIRKKAVMPTLYMEDIDPLLLLPLGITFDIPMVSCIQG